MRRTRTLLNGMVVLSEISHVFCCVLPTIFSIVGVLVGLGVAGAMPLWLGELHELMHGWELPVIAASGIVLALGWTLHYVSERMDCHDSGCHHPPCEPQKKNSALVLKIATLLFVGNISVFLIFHKGLDRLGLTQHTEQHQTQTASPKGLTDSGEGLTDDGHEHAH